MVLLALDQASITSGYAIFQEDKLIFNGKFTLNDENMGKRLFNFKKYISDLIVKYNVDEVAYEDIYVDKEKIGNVHTFKVLAEVYGVLTELLYEKNIPHASYLGAQWKSGIGIQSKKRPDQKKEAQKYVLDNYSKKVTQDEADAICIGIHHIHKKNSELNWE